MYIIVAPIPRDLAAVVQRYRQQFDPWQQLIQPHIVIMPPFEFAGAQAALYEHLAEVGETHAPIKVSLVGWDIHQKTNGYRLRLPLIAGMSEFAALHQQLLTGPLQQLPQRSYQPHVPFGRLSSQSDIKQIRAQLAGFEPQFIFRVTHFELYHKTQESPVWQLSKKFGLEATLASSRRRKPMMQPLSLKQKRP